MIKLSSSLPEIHLISFFDIHGNVIDDDDVLRALTDHDVKEIFKTALGSRHEEEGGGSAGITLGSIVTSLEPASPSSYANLTTLFGLTAGYTTEGEDTSADLDFLCHHDVKSYLDLAAPSLEASRHSSTSLQAPFSGIGGGSSNAMDLSASHHFSRGPMPTQGIKRKSPGEDKISLDLLPASSDTARTKYLDWTETDLNELQKGSYLISFYNLYLKVYGVSEKDRINTFFATVLLKYNELRILMPDKIVKSSFWTKLEDAVYKSCDSKFPIFTMFLRKYGFLIPLFYEHHHLYLPGKVDKFLTTLENDYKINIKHVRPFVRNIIEIFGKHLHPLIPRPDSLE